MCPEGKYPRVPHTFLLRMGLLATLGRGRDQEPLSQLSLISAEKVAFSSWHLLDTGAHSCIPHGWGQGWGKLLLQSQKVLLTGPVPLCTVISSGCSPGAATSQPSRRAFWPSKRGRGCPLSETAFLCLAGHCSPNKELMSGEVSHAFLP